jgi:hypothetical protein
MITQLAPQDLQPATATPTGIRRMFRRLLLTLKDMNYAAGRIYEVQARCGR